MSLNSDLAQLKTLWLDKKTAGEKLRDKRFGKDAIEIDKFYKGPHDFIFAGRDNSHIFLGDIDTDIGQPTFKIGINKVAEFMHLYLPFLVGSNPDRVVNPRLPKIPEFVLQAAGIQYSPELTKSRKHIKAALQQSYLNYTPNELGLKQHVRRAVFDALEAGRGVMWIGLVPAYGGFHVGSFYDSWKRLIIDPDASSMQRAGWIMHERCLPVWEAERMFGHPPGYLKRFASVESANTQTVLDGRTSNSVDTASKRAMGQTADTIKFYEVYSRMGLGGYLSGASREFQDMLPMFGDYAYLAVSEDCDFPLNLPPYLFEGLDPVAVIQEKTAWPFEFYKDPTDPWPCAVVDLHPLNEEAWPLAPFQPVLGEQEWLDWCYSFLAGKVKNVSRDLIMLPASLSNTQVDKILHGADLEHIPIDHKHMEHMKDIPRYIQGPQVHPDLWNMAARVEEAINTRTGINDLIRGNYSKQMRSAAEADAKKDFSLIRPDYYADCVDDFLSMLARKEALVAQQVVTPRQISIMCGELQTGVNPMNGQPVEQLGLYGQLWAQYVTPQSFDEAAAEFDYRIEAGQARRPNRAAQQAAIDESAQFIVPLLGDVWKQTGDPTALNNWFAKWAEARQMDPDTIKVPDMTQYIQQMQMQQQMQQQQMPPEGPPVQ